MAAKKSRNSKSPAPPKEEKDVAADVLPPPPSSSSSKKKKKNRTANVTAVSADNEVNASKMKKKNKKKQQVVEPEPEEQEESESEDDMKLTLEALDDISDESDDDEDGGGGDEAVAEATARLRKMIQEGQFDGLLKQSKNKQQGKKNDVESDNDDEEDEEEEEEGDELEEDELDTSMNAEVDDDDDDDDNVEKEEEEEEVEEDGESEEEDAEEKEQSSKRITQAIALAAAMEGTDRHLPWPETFTVVPPTSLPFGSAEDDDDVSGKKRKRTTASEESDEEEDEFVDIHDDLKREVAFYDNAMEAVRIARNHCDNSSIPFTRPEDFFAEMIKSDDHMAKIKDRLIFETKKIEAVERRKSNKEQTVMAKERAAHRIAEKSKAKKAHMSAVEDWRKSAEQGRGRLGGKVNDMDEDMDQLHGLGGPNKKRMNADKRYGFGGRRGRFKQNDPKELNDMSGFKPRGSFAGGQKTTNTYGKGKKGGGGGAKRPGKRARDARR